MACAAPTTLLWAPQARAHAFGQRYDLPLPLDLYLAGAGGAVALSFVVMALVFRAPPAGTGRPGIDLLRFRPLGALLHPATIAVLQTVSVGLFLLVLTAGLFGAEDPLKNFAPTFVWVIWWVGLAYVAALAGNPWPVINPWSIVFAGLEKLARLFGARGRLDLGLAYPSWLGVWPAVALFGLFAWFELIVEASKEPGALATAVLIYSGITWLGMAAFGREVWLAHGEAFSLAFGVLGRFAPIDRPERDAPDGGPAHWYLRPYAGGLIPERPCRLSMMVFVLLMLSTVAFDGFKETPLHAGLLQWIASEPLFHPVLLTLHEFGLDLIAALDTVMLALSPLLFLLVYLGFSWLAKEVADSEPSVTEIAGLFVFSLVPIAIAYHLAHYLSYLLIAGQLIIPLASDPFGIGSDIFGTAGYRIDIGIIGAKFVWYSAVVAIVAGHVFAVGVAHFVALRVFESAGAALRSQYPFLILMVAYTMVSLWILSQPIVGGPNLSSLRAPSGTVSLAPFEFQELCFELARQDEVRYDFQSDPAVEFNIHYHDGLRIRYPVKLMGVTLRADRFVAELDQAYCLMWFNRNLTEASLTYRISGP
jgi:hypothetical protein